VDNACHSPIPAGDVPVFAPNPQQIEPSVAHFPWTGKLRTTAADFMQSIEIIVVFYAIAA
jgi:hypothetical protein